MRGLIRDVITVSEVLLRIVAFRLGALGCRMNEHDLVVVDGTRAWCKRCRQTWGHSS